MKKRGYFFTLDAFLALGILVIGVAILMSSYTRTPEKEQTTNIAEDTLNFFANTKIENFNNPYFGASGTFVQEGYIKDTQKTLLQQLGQFYYDSELDKAESLITNVTKELILFQYNYEFLIDNVTICPRSPSEEFKKSKTNMNILFPARKLSFGTINKSLDLFGPYEVEVLVWQ